MVSNIDENQPNTGIDQPVQVIRDNFAIAKVEIEDLQAVKLDRNGDNMLGVLSLAQVATANLPSPAANISGILFNTDTASLSFSNGLTWITVADAGGDLESVNNLSDVVNSQTSIDNLTLLNTVTVDVLRLVDHGSNSQVWDIEEDSANPTNALTFDYANSEIIRITPAGEIIAGSLILLDSISTDDGGISTNLDLTIDAKGIGNVIISSLAYPNIDGTPGQVLTTNGSGSLSFTTVGGLNNVVEDLTPSLGGNLNVGGFGLTTGGEIVLSFAAGGETGVNNVEVVNGETGFSPIVRAVGSDTNVDLTLDAKGTGNIVVSGISYPNADGSPGDRIVTDGSGNLSFTAPSPPPVVDTSVLAFRIDPTVGPAPTIISPADAIVILGSGAPAQLVLLPPAGIVSPGKTLILTKGFGTPDAIIVPSGGDIIDPFGPGPEASLLFIAPSFAGGFKSVTLASDGIGAWFVISTGY